MTAKKLISIEKVFLATGLALLLLAGSAFADDECAGCHASLSNNTWSPAAKSRKTGDTR